MRHESQKRAIEALEEALLFIRNLPEWVEVATIELIYFHHEVPEIKLQIHEESFARLLAGKKVRRFSNGTMAIGEIDGFQLYSSIKSDHTPDGPYVMPALATTEIPFPPALSEAVAAMHEDMDLQEAEGGVS